MRRRYWCAVVLAVLSVTAAACSGSGPSGAVGSTLAAMSGTVKLDKVIAPAVPVGFSAAAAAHELVAVELTVQAPTKTTYFNNIYSLSKLVDSTNHPYPAKNTLKFPVTDCLGLPAFGPVAAGQSETGCEVFRTPQGTTPVELKISGSHPADFGIAAAAISAARPATAAAGSGLPAPAPVAAPTPAVVPTPAVASPPAGGAGVTPTTAAAGGSPFTGPAFDPGPRLGLHHRHSHVHVGAGGGGGGYRAGGGSTASGGGTPKIKAFTPRGGVAGSLVTVTGRRLSGATRVAINGIAAWVSQDSNSKLELVVPAGATTGHITVTTTAGTSASTALFLIG